MAVEAPVRIPVPSTERPPLVIPGGDPYKLPLPASDPGRGGGGGGRKPPTTTDNPERQRMRGPYQVHVPLNVNNQTA